MVLGERLSASHTSDPLIDCCCCRRCVLLNELVRAKQLAALWSLGEFQMTALMDDPVMQSSLSLLPCSADGLHFPFRPLRLRAPLHRHAKVITLLMYILLLDGHSDYIIPFDLKKIAPQILSYNHIWQLVYKVKPQIMFVSVFWAKACAHWLRAFGERAELHPCSLSIHTLTTV